MDKNEVQKTFDVPYDNREFESSKGYDVSNDLLRLKFRPPSPLSEDQ